MCELNFFKRNIKNKKSISPLIATILLIVVAVSIIIIVLSWSRTFTGDSLDLTSQILREDESLIGFVQSKQITTHPNTFEIKNISNKPITIDRYEIIYPVGEEYDLLNTTFTLTEPLDIFVNNFNHLPLICIPDKDFILNLITEDDTYVSININNAREHTLDSCKTTLAGEGSEENPFKIYNIFQLDKIRDHLDDNSVYFSLEKDLDFNDLNNIKESKMTYLDYFSRGGPPLALDLLEITQIIEFKQDIYLKRIYYVPFIEGNYKLEIGTELNSNDIYQGDLIYFNSTDEQVFDLSGYNLKFNKNQDYYFKITLPNTRPNIFGLNSHDGFLWKGKGVYYNEELVLNRCLRLNIEVDGYIKNNNFNFYPIGSRSSFFDGVFDGNNKTIKNLNINLPNIDNVGFFNKLNPNSIFKNTNFKDVNITGNGNVVDL